MKKDEQAALLELLCQENPAVFAATKLSGPAEAPFNGAFATGAHHQVWADDVVKHKKLVELAARGLGKSFFFSFGVPLWMARYNPGRTGFLLSGSQPQAEEILLRIAREVESNPKLAKLLPRNRTKVRWSSRTLEFANDFVLHARGYGTKVRGGHPVLCVCDDILNDETMYSGDVRKKNTDYFLSAIRNMLDPDGRLIVVGTPFHSEDLYHVLRDTPGYFFRITPGVKADGSSVWPERYSTKYFKDLLAEIKSMRFDREILCRPTGDLSALFPSSLFEGNAEVRGVPLGQSWRWWQARGVTRRYMGVDFSVSTEMGHDYACIFVIGVDCRGNHWVIDIFRKQGMTYNAQKSKINEMAIKYRPEMIYVESVQAQKIFGDELINETDLPIRHFVTSKKKHTFEDGLPGLRVLLENGKLRVPRGNEYAIEVTNAWISEMQSFTLKDGKCLSIAKHDDTVMAFYIAEQAAQDATFGYSFGSDADDEAAALEEETLMALEAEEEARLAEEEANEAAAELEEGVDAVELERVFGIAATPADRAPAASAAAPRQRSGEIMDLGLPPARQSASPGMLPLTGAGIPALELMTRKW